MQESGEWSFGIHCIALHCSVCQYSTASLSCRGNASDVGFRVRFGLLLELGVRWDGIGLWHERECGRG